MEKEITVWRIFAYFIIYSILGFVIETIFAFLMYGVIESRQSFLLGPFCSIYGIGAVIMILLLRYFNKNNYTLFLGGYLIGSIVEYIISWLGELILHTRWWDYSYKFLNINGRICLTYSVFWGILAIFLIKTINPKVDKFIDWLGSKINKNAAKVIVTVIIVFMAYDAVISSLAQNWVMTKVVVENNLDVRNKDIFEENYKKVYSNENEKKFVDKYWTIQRVLYAYPNLTTYLQDGTKLYIKTLYPEIHPYLYRNKPDPIMESIYQEQGETQ